jgi:hypothetical protein
MLPFGLIPSSFWHPAISTSKKKTLAMPVNSLIFIEIEVLVS